MKYLKKFSEHSDYLNLLPNDLPNISYCELEDELHYNLYTSSNKTNFINLYFTTVALESGTIDFTLFSWADTTYVESFAYSKNGGEWVETQNSDNRGENIVISISVIEGDKVRWKGIASHIGLGSEDDNGGVFTSTCRFDVQGNIMSLLYGDDFKGKITLENGDEFSYLFCDINNENGCLVVNTSNLILPATTLADDCYRSMFSECTSLVTAPELPALELISRCYQYMFSGCTSLVTAPELSATILAESCYGGMFQGCTSLTIVPKLPAITLMQSCYQYMFQNCTGLTTAPSLPATTLADRCYGGMFQGCTSLTVAPELSTTMLTDSCYFRMFKNCTSLTTAPELFATILTQGCYNAMFQGCTNLNSITCLATDISATDCTKNWVQGVASSGIFIKADNTNWLTGASGIPEGWNVYTESEYEVVRHYELDESELAISAALNDLNSRTSLTEITYAELKELRDNSNLVPGKQYRIIDYVTTVNNYAESNARSANHQFDIIVTADSVNKLNEQARAIQHTGDTYFANSNLKAWELKYQLDNIKWSKLAATYIIDEDNNHTFQVIGNITLVGHTYQLLLGFGTYVEDWSNYALMDSLEEGETIYCYYGDPEDFDPERVGTASTIDVATEEGKGTVLWMKDEWNNECPYDFKNIQFKRWKVMDTKSGRNGLNNLYMVAYLLNIANNLNVDDTEDYIWAYTFSSDNSGGEQTDFSLGNRDVHDNVFKQYDGGLPNNVMFGEGNYGNSFGLNCYQNSWGNYCFNNSWGNNCTGNFLGNSCSRNSLGNNCVSNSWGNSCYCNSWGNSCNNNSWGNDCTRNSWGNECSSNSWGNSCQNNSWGNGCGGNSWGNSCNYNSWGNDCGNNSCGNNCSKNSWGNYCYANSWSNEVTNSTVFDGVQYTQITTTGVKFVQVLNGVRGTSSSSKLTLAFAANKTYTQVACMTSAGALKIYVPGDLS